MLFLTIVAASAICILDKTGACVSLDFLNAARARFWSWERSTSLLFVAAAQKLDANGTATAATKAKGKNICILQNFFAAIRTNFVGKIHLLNIKK